MSQRLSRKQIKRDEFKESLGSAIHFISENLRLIGGVLIAALLVAVVAVVVIGYRQRQEDRANDGLARALKAYGAEIDAISPRPDDPVAPSFADQASREARARELLEQLREDYRGTDAADVAAVHLGQLEAAAGNLEEARRLWEEVLQRQGDHMLSSQVRLNLMRLDRAEGRGEELATRLQAMLDAGDHKLPPDLLLEELILTREALGEAERAQDARRRLVEEYPDSPFAARARSRVTPPPTGP